MTLPNLPAAGADRAIVSLFAGGGGLDAAAHLAGLRTAVALEIDADACATLRRNGLNAIQGDIAVLTDDDPECQAILDAASLKVGEAFAVVGGPRCQSYSTAGKRRGAADPRGQLYRHMLTIIRALRPEFAVFENVPEFADASSDPSNPNAPTVREHIVAELRAMGFKTIVWRVLNAVSYGAPQFRRRFVLIASREGDDVSLPAPTHFQRHQDPARRWQTFRDAVVDLADPGPGYGEGKRRCRYLAHIPPGGSVLDLPSNLRDEVGGAREGSTFLRRLAWNEPAPTLTTDPSRWRAMMAHPTELRLLSVREYARLQGFPDDWTFEGALRDQYRQIGNAVPTQLGLAIFQSLIAAADGTSAVKVRRKSAAKLPTAADLATNDIIPDDDMLPIVAAPVSCQPAGEPESVETDQGGEMEVAAADHVLAAPGQVAIMHGDCLASLHNRAAASRGRAVRTAGAVTTTAMASRCASVPDAAFQASSERRAPAVTT